MRYSRMLRLSLVIGIFIAIVGCVFIYTQPAEGGTCLAYQIGPNWEGMINPENGDEWSLYHKTWGDYTISPSSFHYQLPSTFGWSYQELTAPGMDEQTIKSPYREGNQAILKATAHNLGYSLDLWMGNEEFVFPSLITNFVWHEKGAVFHTETPESGIVQFIANNALYPERLINGALSPDGSLVARLNGTDLEVFRLDDLVNEHLAPDQSINIDSTETYNWIRWSPNSKFIAILKRDPTGVVVDVADLETSKIQSTGVKLNQRTSLFPIRWSANGDTLVAYLDDERGGNIIQIDVKSGDYVTLASNLVGAPDFSFENKYFYLYDEPQDERLVTFQQTDDGIMLQTWDTNGKKIGNPVSNLESIEATYWLPDGEHFIVMARSINKYQIMLIDGLTGIANTSYETEKAVVLVNGTDNHLFFVEQMATGFNFNKVDLLTGETQMLISNPVGKFWSATLNLQDHTFVMAWYPDNGSTQLGVYDLDGKQKSDFLIDSNLSQISAFFSPNQQAVFILADNRFYVAESNDDKPSQPYTTIEHLIGSFYNSPWNQIRWSPDSQKVAIMYQRTNQAHASERFSLDIIDKSGKLIRQYSSHDYWYPAITWRACEHESIVTKGQHGLTRFADRFNF